jgi:hypothetical protein
LATFPVVQGLTAVQGATEYYAHEVGINEVAADGTVLPQLLLTYNLETLI